MQKKKRKYVKKTPRKKLIEEAESLLFQILCHERGKQCELCRGTFPRSGSRLGLFHILPKGSHPRLRFHKQNLLIAGWFCCHLPWHHSYYVARDRIVPVLKRLRGNNWEITLRSLEMEQPSITLTYLKLLVRALKKELKTIENGWQHGREL